MDVLRALLSQSNLGMVKFRKKFSNYKITLLIAIIILLFFSMIITMSFTSLLLRSYFKLDELPLIGEYDQLPEKLLVEI